MILNYINTLVLKALISLLSIKCLPIHGYEDKFWYRIELSTFAVELSST